MFGGREQRPPETSSLQVRASAADAQRVIEATAVRWQRYGKDRVYVTARDGSKVGWHDLLTGSTHCEQPERVDLLSETIGEWRARNGYPALAVQGHVPQQAQSMKVPAPLQVNGFIDPGFDLATRPAGWGPFAKLEELRESERALRVPGEQLEAQRQDLRRQDRALRSQSPLRHFLMALAGRATPERVVLRDQIRGVRNDQRTCRTETRNRLRSLQVESRPWRLGMDGEVIIGRLLEQFVQNDPRWRVLHAIPVGKSGSDIDHLLIGPSGVYTLNTKHHPGANVFVAHDAVLVNGTKYPYVRNSRHEAERAGRLLSAACKKPVPTAGVIVPVGIQKFVVKAQPRDVVVIPRTRLAAWLAAGPVELDATAVEVIYRAARRVETWGS